MDRTGAARVLACLLTAVGVAGGQILRAGAPEPPEGARLERIPRHLGRWEGRDLHVPPSTLAELQSDGFLFREYVAPGSAPVRLLVDYHARQRLGAQVHSPRICYPGSGWSVSAAGMSTIPWGGGALPAGWLDLVKVDGELLVVYWYASRWGTSARAWDLKIATVRSAFARLPADAALVRISTPVLERDRRAAHARVESFLRAFGGALREALPFSVSAPARGAAARHEVRSGGGLRNTRAASSALQAGETS